MGYCKVVVIFLCSVDREILVCRNFCLLKLVSLALFSSLEHTDGNLHVYYNILLVLLHLKKVSRPKHFATIVLFTVMAANLTTF